MAGPTDWHRAQDNTYARTICSQPTTGRIAPQGQWRIKNVGLWNATVMQSFAIDSGEQAIYATQLMAGGIQLADEAAPLTGAQRDAAGDQALTKLCPKGHVIGHMYLRGFGHGTQIGVQRDGTTPWIWTGADTSATGNSRSLARFQFANNTVLDSNTLTYLRPTGAQGVGVSVNVDQSTNRVLYKQDQSGGSSYALYNLADVLAGAATPLYPPLVVNIAGNQDPSTGPAGSFQGMCSLGDTIYLYAGHALTAAPAGDTWLYAYNATDGRLIQAQKMTLGLREGMNYREAEGIAIHLPAYPTLTPATLWHGFAEGITGARTACFATVCADTPAPADQGAWGGCASGTDDQGHASTVRIGPTGLAYPDVVASFGLDNTHRTLYAAQTIYGGVQLAGETAPLTRAERWQRGDLAVQQYDRAGHQRAVMWLRGFGHGSQIGVETDAAGNTWLWVGADADDSGSAQGLSRILHADNTVIDSTSRPVFYPAGSPMPDTTVGVDPVAGHLAVRWRLAGDLYRAALYDIVDAASDLWTPLAEITYREGQAPDIGVSTFRGLATLDGRLYVQHQQDEGPDIWLTVFDWTTGAVVSNERIQGAQSGAERIAGGLAVYQSTPDASSGVLWHGLSTGPADARLAAFAQFGGVCGG